MRCWGWPSSPADRSLTTRRLDLARGGYLMTAAATGAIGLAATVWQADVLRAVSWVARGARSPARDAMLASLATPAAYGRAFGLERAGDNLGAVIGPLLAAVLVAGFGIRPAPYLAAVPGVLAAVAITAAATQAARQTATPTLATVSRRLELRAVLGSGLGRPLIAIGLFEFGNCATTLLILRTTNLLHHGGRSLVAATSLAIVLYAMNNLCGSIVALGGGRWIDDAGPRAPFASAHCCLPAHMRSSRSDRTPGGCCCSRSPCRAAASASQRPPSPRWWPPASPARCTAAALRCWADCNPPAISRPPQRPG